MCLYCVMPSATIPTTERIPAMMVMLPSKNLVLCAVMSPLSALVMTFIRLS